MDLIKRGKGYIKGEEKDIKNIWKRIRQRDFSGNTGLAVKNSIYQFGTTIIAKVGSLIFIMVLARLLMPELFGLYSLALSTIILFIGFTDLGIGSGMILFLSRALSKKKKSKAKSILFYLFKLRIYLVFVVIFMLLLLSRFLSETYYQKPIFLALLVGALYIFFRSFVSFFRSIFYALNDFKHPFYWEIFFQVCRILLVPLVVIFFLTSIINNPSYIFIVILTLAFVWFLTLILILFFFFFSSSTNFLKTPSKKISFKEKVKVKKIIFPLSVIALSGIFFGYIDIFVLGRFVLSEFIGYYHAAFSLIGAGASLLTFSAVLFPIFSRITGKRSQRALDKSLKITFLVGILATLATFVLAPLLIKIIFGNDYLLSITFLRIFSVLILILPLNGIYVSHLISKGKTAIIARLLISTTLINIFLNFAIASLLISSGPLAVVLGICGTTIFSKLIYLGGLIHSEKKLRIKEIKFKRT